MKLKMSKRGAWAMAFGLGLGGLGYFTSGQWYPAVADEITRLKAGQGATVAAEETISGVAKELLRNDHDDFDRLLLDNGREIHFPPHLGQSVAKLIQPGKEVQVVGNQVTHPRGEVVFEATRIESQGESLNLERPRPPRHPFPVSGGPRARIQPEVAMNATGIVQEVCTNRHGDVDGLRLADGTEVKFPPHQGRELQSLVAEGEKVRIEGRRHETPHGDIHLHADKITVVNSGKSIDRDGTSQGRPQPPHERERRNRDADLNARPDAPATSAQFEEVLKELREMRKLLEAQQAK